MLEKKKGKIINIGSVAGDRGVPLAGNVGYCSSKAAVGNLTRMLAYEWAKMGINVNAIGPSVIFTPMMKNALPPWLERWPFTPSAGWPSPRNSSARVSIWPRQPPTT